MRFQFCGNNNAAEWFLAESSILSKITSVKLRLVVTNVFKHLIDGIENFEKVYGLLENSGFIRDEIISILASLDYIISNSIRYGVSDDTLLKDLIDLGLPKENCESITKGFRENAQKLREKKEGNTFKVSKLEKIDYNVNEIISSKKLRNPQLYDTKYAEISLAVKDKSQSEKTEDIRFTMTKEKTLTLLAELKKAQEIIEKI